MSSSRPIIDLVLQNSTIDLFASYGIAIAPGMISEAQLHSSKVDYSAAINFLSPGFRGTLTVSAAIATLAAMKRNIQEPAQFRDWTRELTNQLMGRIMNKLARYQLTLDVALPRTIDVPPTRARNPSDGEQVIYAFRTVGPDVFVLLRAHIGSNCLSFSGTAPRILDDGEVIVFDDKKPRS